MGRISLRGIVVILAIIVGSLGGRVLGDDAPPAAPTFKNDQANKAVELEKAAEAKAKADCDKAVIAAKNKLIETLQPLMERATRAGDLDEAVKLRDKIAALKEEIAAITAPKPWVVGEWSVVAKGYHGVMQLNADGSALLDHKRTGRWSIEKNSLVIRWTDGINIDTYTDGTNNVMTGKSSAGNNVLTATRIEK